MYIKSVAISNYRNNLNPNPTAQCLGSQYLVVGIAWLISISFLSLQGSFPSPFMYSSQRHSPNQMSRAVLALTLVNNIRAFSNLDKVNRNSSCNPYVLASVPIRLPETGPIPLLTCLITSFGSLDVRNNSQAFTMGTLVSPLEHRRNKSPKYRCSGSES